MIENIDVLCKPKPNHGYLPGRPMPIPVSPIFKLFLQT